MGGGPERAWWSPRRISWWIAVLFAIGAACFTSARCRGSWSWSGPAVDALVFFVGSIFFTTAAALQCRQAFVAEDALPARRRRLDRWSGAVQLVGTVLFNVDTFRALQTGFSDPGYDRLVWAPDAFGSACFLVSGVLAYVAVSGRRDTRLAHRLGEPARLRRLRDRGDRLLLRPVARERRQPRGREPLHLARRLSAS